MSSNFAPPQPCSTAASFQARFATSSMPVLRPKPPVGVKRLTAIAGEDHAAFAEAIRDQCVTGSPRLVVDDLEIDVLAEAGEAFCR